ncbi:MAG: MXAN_5187 C-terminal domain-containing protein [Myxococcota bacterium]
MKKTKIVVPLFGAALAIAAVAWATGAVPWSREPTMAMLGGFAAGAGSVTSLFALVLCFIPFARTVEPAQAHTEDEDVRLVQEPEYTPSFDSVVFALSEVDPDAELSEPERPAPPQARAEPPARVEVAAQASAGHVGLFAEVNASPEQAPTPANEDEKEYTPSFDSLLINLSAMGGADDAAPPAPQAVLSPRPAPVTVRVEGAKAEPARATPDVMVQEIKGAGGLGGEISFGSLISAFDTSAPPEEEPAPSAELEPADTSAPMPAPELRDDELSAVEVPEPVAAADSGTHPKLGFRVPVHVDLAEELRLAQEVSKPPEPKLNVFEKQEEKTRKRKNLLVRLPDPPPTKKRVLTPRRDVPEQVVQLSVRSSRRGDEDTMSQHDIQRLYQEFMAALRRCGTIQTVDFELFSERVKLKRERVRRKYKTSQLDMKVLVEEGKARIKIRPAR